MSTEVEEGDFYAIPLGDGREALCRVLFKSNYFRNVVLLGCCGFNGTGRERSLEGLELIGRPTYTSCNERTTRTWRRVGHIALGPSELDLSLRTSGGIVWKGDSVLGDASEDQMRCLPKMDVFGDRIFLKKILRDCEEGNAGVSAQQITAGDAGNPRAPQRRRWAE